jgi:hypothetical protein
MRRGETIASPMDLGAVMKTRSSTSTEKIATLAE